ncbi:MAG: glycosyltransferase family 2 protein [Candidatus Methylomirabilia bacterium]
MRPELSVVIPVFNSEGNLVLLCAQIGEALAGIRHEVILVDDRSRDRSWEVIREIAGRSPEVAGIRLRKNSGQDNAIMAGLRSAKGNYVVVMDDDLQHSPADILALYRECAKGFDVCYAKFSVKRQAAWKNAGSWLNGKAAEILIDKPPGIYLSPFKVLARGLVREIVRYRGPFPYIDGQIFMVTSNIAQIESVAHNARQAGESNYTLWRSVKVFLKLATNFSALPLRAATALGFACSLLGFVLTVYFLGEYLMTEKAPEGWTSLVLINLFFFGVTLIAIGLLGEYVGRLFVHANRTANVYSVAERTPPRQRGRDTP